DSSKGTRSPLARCRKSRLSASWQSRHQRWVSSCLSAISVCMAVSSRRRRSGVMPAWQLEQGKMPSENGGGGTSTLSGPVAEGVFRPSAATSRANPDSTDSAAAAMRRLLYTAQLHHALNLAQPHGLEEMQALADDARQIPGDDLPGLRVLGEITV